jgi:poly-gamma-glutamate capsule biosynthesis protein CapA/YwtB (metallophosphatase superfamily)
LPLGVSVPLAGAANNRGDLTVTAVGDVRVTAALIHDHSEQLRRLHLKGDLVFANFEGVIGDPVASDPWKFAVPAGAAGTFLKMGVSAVSMANNHAMDLGVKAYSETAAALRREGFWVAGNDEQGIAARIKNRRVRVFAFSFSSPQNNVNNPEAVPAAFPRNAAELVIVSAHIGGESQQASWIPGTMEYFGDEQRGDVIAFSHRCIDAGADLVLGHSPHVPRGLELYKGKLIVYSLGNFIFDYPGAAFHPHAPGYSITIHLNANGSFRNARIHSYDLRNGVPVSDKTEKAYYMIRDLTLHNLKQTTLAFPGNGRVVSSSKE